MSLKEHKKEIIENKEFSDNVEKSTYSQKEFFKVFAVEKCFTEVDFSQCTFTSCYFRNCTFIRCNFTGSHFKESYLRGTKFPESSFKYTTFDKSAIDDNFLDTCLPSEENLARDLVRSLRVNFSQIGNYEAVNKAASIEVKLTGIHLYKAAYSKESYYRGKAHYSGWNRLFFIGRHVKWKFLDFLWGNGESIAKVIISAYIFIAFISIINWSISYNFNLLDYFSASNNYFWGLPSNINLSNVSILTLTISRLIFFSLFISILVKKLAKR